MLEGLCTWISPELSPLASALWVILLCPLSAFVIQTFLGRRLPRGGDWVSITAIFVSFIFSLLIFCDTLFKYDPQFKETISWGWISLPSLTLNFGFLIDNITVLMLVVVSFIGFLIHIYSIGYMKNDPRYFRYYAYLSFFSFSMLGLVVVDNLFSLYIFWEWVGLSSYLLIGFWFEKPAAADAGKKAFIVNRIGDVGFFIGILLIFFQTKGLVNYDAVFGAVTHGVFNEATIFGLPLLTIAGICLFLGAVGKSAQFPLHVWLPDAMEGPTPISALIHAATMVAAGVYLVTRMFPFFTPDALLIIAYTGSFTAIFAATMALTHNDIKKILAYSTISQLGFMMMGLGVGSYTGGFFHLVTHAAFKACLFLCSGSVIHALHTQNLNQMGGLRKKMPITFVTMLIATLAISGVPFFSGFVSKELILSATFSFATAHPAHLLIPIFGFTATGLTAFYMCRLLFLTFFGSPQEPKRFETAHESPWTMTTPLMILSLLSFAFVFTGSPMGLGEIHLFGDRGSWFEHLIQNPFATATAEGHEGTLALILSLIAVTTGILFSYLIYYKKSLSSEKISEACKGLYQTFVHLYWIDELYEWTIVKNQMRLNTLLAHFDNQIIDRIFVDGWAPITAKTSTASGNFDNTAIDQTLVDGTGKVISECGIGVRKIQTGHIQQYLLIGLGMLIVSLVLYVLWRELWFYQSSS